MERQCFGHDVVSHRMRTLMHHSVGLRFDVEDEEDTSDDSRFMVSLCSLRLICMKGKLKIQMAWIEMLYSYFRTRFNAG